MGGNTPLPASVFEQDETRDHVHISGYQRTECPSGNHRGLWAAMIALQFLTSIGYAVHAAMALKVKLSAQRRDKAIASGELVEIVDENVKRQREEEARQRWREMGNL